MKNKNVVLVIVAVVIVAALLAVVAFAGKDDTNKTGDDMNGMHMNSTQNSDKTANDAVATNEVEIEDYAFKPEIIKVKVGTTVTWTNKDSVEHNIVADEQSDDAPNGPLLNKGESYSFTFEKTGTYGYHCDPHPYMKATVIVEE
jgi:amicyanin